MTGAAPDDEPPRPTRDGMPRGMVRGIYSLVIAAVCITLLAGYGLLVLQYRIPDWVSLALGLALTLATWKERSARGLGNGLFACGVILTALALLVSLLHWFS